MEFGVNKKVLILLVLVGMFVNSYSRPILTDTLSTKKYKSAFYLKPLNLILLNASGAFELNYHNDKGRKLGVSIPITIGVLSNRVSEERKYTRKIWTTGLGLKLFSIKRPRNFIYPLLEFGKVRYINITDHSAFAGQIPSGGHDWPETAAMGIFSLSVGKQIILSDGVITLEPLLGSGIRVNRNLQNSFTWIYPIVKFGFNIGFNF